MANTPMLNLPVATSLDGTEYVWIVQGGTDKRASTNLIITSAGNLPLGGTQGQVLVKNSATYGDSSWSSNLVDSNGATQLAFITGVTSGVNYTKVTNAITSDPATIGADGPGSNIGYRIASKGTGSVFLNTNGVDRITISDTTITVALPIVFTGSVSAASFIPTGSTVPTNGLYLPAANTLGWAVNSAAELQLTASAFSPAASGGSTLGTAALPWLGLQLSNTAVITFNNAYTITHSTGLLTLNGNLTVSYAGAPDVLVTSSNSNSAGYAFFRLAGNAQSFDLGVGGSTAGDVNKFLLYDRTANNRRIVISPSTGGTAIEPVAGVISLGVAGTTYYTEILSTKSSSSTTTGALTVAGGLGVAGAGYFGGQIVYTGSTGIDLLIGNWAGDARYNAISFNNTLVATDIIGMFAAGSGASDNQLYFNVPTSASFQWRVNNSLVMYSDASAFRHAGYLRVGSTSAPTNTTAGDLTFVRGFGSTSLTVAGAQTSVIIAPYTSSTNYNAISLNGALTNTTMTGFASGATSDNFLYFLVRTGASYVFKVNDVNITTLDASKLSLAQNTASTSTTSGTLVVTGGVGVSGAYYGGASLTAHAGTAIPAGGTAGAGLLVSSTANFGIFFGSGAPTLSAAKGSIYLRSDGSTTNDRAYINTNGSTTWTALTTVA